MKPLSQKELSNLRNLYESIHTPKEELTEEILDEVFNELVDELIEEGYEEEEAIDIIESATDEYIEEAKVTFGHDTIARNFYGVPVGAKRRYARRKAGEALKGAKKAVKGAASGAYKTAKAKAASAAVDVSLAGSMAKKKAGEVKQAVKDAPSKARAAASDAKKKAKSGIKGFIKRQAQKVVKRMSEEIEELEATGLFTVKEIEAIMEADSLAAMQARREKRLAAQRKREGTTVTGRDFGHDYSLTPAQQKARREAEFKAGIAKGRTKKEEVEAVMEADSLAAMQARREKRLAAQRKREGTTVTGRDFGHDYSLTPAQQKARREAEFKAGIAKGRTKKEEVEYVDEGLTGERYKAALKKGKQYSRRVSPDPAKRATRGGRGGESDFGAGDRGTGNRAARRAGTYQEENFELWVYGLVEEGYDLSDYTWDEMYEFYLAR